MKNREAFDIFDEIEAEDPFDGVQTTEETSIENIKNELSALLDKVDDKERKKEKREITEELKDFIKAEIAKIKPVQNVIERTIEKKIPVHIEPKIIQAPPAPPQIIKEVRVEVPTEKKDTKKYAEEGVIKELRDEIAELKKMLEDQPKNPVLPFNGMGFRTGKIIPSLSGNSGKYLKANGSKLEWATVVSGGGASISGYTVADTTTLKTLPADASLDDLRQVLGTLLTELQS